MAGATAAVLGGAAVASGVIPLLPQPTGVAADAAPLPSATAAGDLPDRRENAEASRSADRAAPPGPRSEAAVSADAARWNALAAAGADPLPSGSPDGATTAESPPKAVEPAPAPEVAPEVVEAPEPVLPAGGTPESNRELARAMAEPFGWVADQWECLDALWQQESSWNHLAENPSSGAYGIPQSLPASKLATHGDDWATNPATQIAWGLDYIVDRYGTPCSAWSFHRGHNWY